MLHYLGIVRLRCLSLCTTYASFFSHLALVRSTIYLASVGCSLTRAFPLSSQGWMTWDTLLKQMAHPFGFSFPRGLCFQDSGNARSFPGTWSLCLPHLVIRFCGSAGAWGLAHRKLSSESKLLPECHLASLNTTGTTGVAPFHSVKIKYVTRMFHWNEEFISMILRSTTVHGFSYWAANMFYRTLT